MHGAPSVMMQEVPQGLMEWVQEGMKEEEWRQESEEGKDFSTREGEYDEGEMNLNVEKEDHGNAEEVEREVAKE